jgi:hypothetical protein
VKPIRAYSDGQWLLLLWAFIVFFLIAGLFLHITALVVVALLGGAGAGYTTYLYVQTSTGAAARPPSDNGRSDTDDGDRS